MAGSVDYVHISFYKTPYSKGWQSAEQASNPTSIGQSFFFPYREGMCLLQRYDFIAFLKILSKQASYQHEGSFISIWSPAIPESRYSGFLIRNKIISDF